MMCQNFVLIPKRESTSLEGERHLAPEIVNGRRGADVVEMGVVLKERAVITS